MVVYLPRIDLRDGGFDEFFWLCFYSLLLLILGGLRIGVGLGSLVRARRSPTLALLAGFGRSPRVRDDRHETLFFLLILPRRGVRHFLGCLYVLFIAVAPPEVQH